MGTASHLQRATHCSATRRAARPPTPRLIHYSTTARTVQAAHARFDREIVTSAAAAGDAADGAATTDDDGVVAVASAPPPRCCVLVDRVHGRDELLALRRRRPARAPDFELLCSSVLLDDLLRLVRVWARLGYEAAEIQRELDQRFAGVLTSELLALHGRSRRGGSAPPGGDS